MKILAIETSGVTFSAALSENGRVVSEVFWRTGLSHSESLIPAVNRLFKRNRWKLGELDKIAVSTGPGSFTGIRVGLTFARTAAQNLGIPVTAVNTLDILAENVGCGQNAEPAIDALRNEVYVRAGGNGCVKIESLDRFLNRLKRKKNSTKILGSAAVSYAKEIKNVLGPKALFSSEEANYPRAGKLAIMAEFIGGQGYETIKPLYVRRSWAEEKNKK
jgi:tRNA threonylcarbamoyladenosine biosynthesis protein TsaB